VVIPALKLGKKLDQLRALMASSGIDAWLIYDFEQSDPTGTALLGKLTPHSRQYAIIIAQDDPIVIIKSGIEAHELARLGAKLHTVNYRTQAEFRQAVHQVATGYARIAANYSQNPQTDVLPTGRFELLRSTLPSAKWVPGENLMQIIHSVLTESQLASHQRAAQRCKQIMEQAFDFIAEGVGTVRERDVVEYILGRFREEELTTSEPPMAAVQANTANPHYTAGNAIIRKNQFVMIDLWAKWDIFADITWMAYTGSRIPSNIQGACAAVLEAQRAAVASIKPNILGSIPDTKAREVLIAAGYEAAILHRTGHSIDATVHGKGANLDAYEMPETRLLMPNLVVSVEPGVYFPGRFGLRSEIDVAITATGCKVTTPAQDSILQI
jgi:Xaa-Pro aminopeptidase